MIYQKTPDKRKADAKNFKKYTFERCKTNR